MPAVKQTPPHSVDPSAPTASEAFGYGPGGLAAILSGPFNPGPQAGNTWLGAASLPARALTNFLTAPVQAGIAGLQAPPGSMEQNRDALNAVLGMGADKFALEGGALPDANTLGTFGGDRARLSGKETHDLYRARLLESNGMSPQDIWTQTGWYRGPDTNWRFQIDDRQSSTTTKDLGGYTLFTGRAVLPLGGTTTTLGKILIHPTLFNKYPDLRNISVTVTGPRPGATRWEGLFRRSQVPGVPAEIEIRAPSYKDLDNLAALTSLPAEGHGVLLHEVQHAIQNIEEHEHGSNPSVFLPGSKDPGYAIRLQKEMTRAAAAKNVTIEDILKNKVPTDVLVDIMDDARYGMYRSVYGEAEARNVQDRMVGGVNMDAFPPGSMDIHPDDFILSLHMADWGLPMDTVRKSK